MSAVRPWDLDPALTEARLALLARVVAETRNKVFAEADREAGDTNWGLGCRAHERLGHALARLADSGEHPWLTVMREGLYLMPLVDGIPIRPYRGTPDRPAARHLDAVRAEAARAQPKQITFDFMAALDDGGPWYWLLALETDARGQVKRAVYFQANEESATRHAWACPLDLTADKPTLPLFEARSSIVAEASIAAESQVTSGLDAEPTPAISAVEDSQSPAEAREDSQSTAPAIPLEDSQSPAEIRLGDSQSIAAVAIEESQSTAEPRVEESQSIAAVAAAEESQSTAEAPREDSQSTAPAIALEESESTADPRLEDSQSIDAVAAAEESQSTAESGAPQGPTLVVEEAKPADAAEAPAQPAAMEASPPAQPAFFEEPFKLSAPPPAPERKRAASPRPRAPKPAPATLPLSAAFDFGAPQARPAEQLSMQIG